MGISLGLIGLGTFGQAFADLFMSHPQVDRVALCDREPERIATFAKKESWWPKFNQRDVYTSLDEICQSDLDVLVSITQPGFVHHNVSRQWRQANMSVVPSSEIACFTIRGEYNDTNLHKSFEVGGGHHGSRARIWSMSLSAASLRDGRPGLMRSRRPNWMDAGICAHESAMQGRKGVSIPSFDV